MSTILISSLLGAFALQGAALEGTEPQKAVVSIWPPGSNIYLGESVLLQCTVESNSTFAWSYHWYRYTPHTALTPNPRHLVSSDSYSITAVTREDAGSYWCKAEWRERNTTSVVLSLATVLIVSEQLPPSLTLTPSTRLIFRGEKFTVQCPPSQANSTGWKLRHFSPSHRETAVVQSFWCSPQGGAAGAKKSDRCIFFAASRNGGLYWCESTEGRSSAVNISVSDGHMILKTPAFPVLEGDIVVLFCHYSNTNHNKTLFFKNGEEIPKFTSSYATRVIEMTINNVTLQDEGFYKCASQDKKMESPESWLSVRSIRGHFTSTDGRAASTSSWIWIVVSCGAVLLFLIPLTIWLLLHKKYKMFCTRSCWPLSKEDVPTVALPATKQDTTEVQWDLSWMEMSNLLDKQLYPGT